jgi:hypothetical protein
MNSRLPQYGWCFVDGLSIDGCLRPPDADPEAAAWLLLSVLSARPWRTAVMPDRDRLAGDVADLALQALVQRP